MSTDPPSASTWNEARADAVQNMLQAGSVGKVVFEGIPGLATRPGLVSTVLPLDRLARPLFGRDDLVSVLVDIVDRNAGSRIVLHGTGGMGKTTVALAVAAELDRRHERPIVWWIDASRESTLSAGLREVAFGANAPVDQVVLAWSGSASAPNVLQRALSACPRPWLIVLDGVDDSRILDDWSSALWQSTGAVLITTRDGRADAWESATDLHPVGPLANQAAADLLCAAAPESGTHAEAVELARTLGDLPLALRLAGRCLNAIRRVDPLPGGSLPLTFVQYADTFRERFRDLDSIHDLGSRLSERQLLSRTWELSLDLLASHGLRWARPLLRWLSCFAPAPIPIRLISQKELVLCSVLFEDMAATDLSRTIVHLVNFGLVERTQFSDGRFPEPTASWLVHPVIREANRHQTDVEEKLHSYVALCALSLHQLASCLSTDLETDMSTWSALGPHCESVVSWIHQIRDVLPDSSQYELLGTGLTCATARFASATGALERSEVLLQHALAVRIRHLGRQHEEVFAVRRALARTRCARHANDESISDLEVLLAECVETLGERHHLTVACRLDLAVARADLADGDGVANALRELVRVCRQVHGRIHADVLTAQIRLVAVLWRQENHPRPETTADSDCPAAISELLAMINELRQTAGVSEVPFDLDWLEASVHRLGRAYHGWSDTPPTG